MNGKTEVAGFLAACLLVVAGCEGSKPSVSTSTTEATVKGKVTLDGKPATGGEVVFDPSNYKRKDAGPRTAKIAADGTYEIKTLTGQNGIRLRGDAVAKQMPIATRRSWTLDVKDGANSYDVDVPAEATKK